MIITNKIQMDLLTPGDKPQVDVMQDDRYSRQLQISLFAEGEAYSLPEGSQVLLSFQKPDGHGGFYDTLPDGRQAWALSGNTVTLALAPQVCTVAGTVQLSVSFIKEAVQLSTFAISLQVRPRPGNFAESEDYYYVRGFLPQPAEAARPGQLLQVSAVDAEGYVRQVKAVDAVVGEGGADGIDGEDGGYYTPSVTQPQPGYMKVSFTASKSDMPELYDSSIELPSGQDGQDGVSPTISVEAITGGHRVTITDASGSQSFDIMDGQDGTGAAHSNAIVAGTEMITDLDAAPVNTVCIFNPATAENRPDFVAESNDIGWLLTTRCTQSNGLTMDTQIAVYTASGKMFTRAGMNGNYSMSEWSEISVGTPAQDGVSPTVSVSEITGGHRIVITDVNGEQSFDVMDGLDGVAGGSAGKENLVLTDDDWSTGYINLGGAPHSTTSASGKHSIEVELAGYSEIILKNSNLSSSGYLIAYYDASKTLLKDISVIVNGSGDGTYAIPANATYAVISNYKNPWVSPSVTFVAKAVASNNIRSDISELKTRVSDMEYWGSGLDTAAFGAFVKFGVIGDSLSVGCMSDSNGNLNGRNLPFSWGQIMARKLGNTCVNFGFSGATTTTWHTHDTYGSVELMQQANKCQAYIIGIGTNDHIAGQDDAISVGTVADVDFSNYDNNAASFYGNYAKIIQKIQTVNPKAIIFCMTIPYSRVDESKNNIIKEMATKFDNCYLVDLAGKYNDWFTTLLQNGQYDGHCTAIGYANLAQVNLKALCDVMNENAEAMWDIGFIPYAL